jgi:hypothetical protein
VSWRRGEVWLDTDVPWLGDGALVPVVAGAEPARLPRFVPDPGLYASRERRAAWQRRRRTRRARATAVVLSPAVVVALAGLRGQLDLRPWPLADDRLGANATLDAASLRAIHDRRDVGGAQPAQVADGGSDAERVPAIRWNRASSVGLPYRGRLVDGTQLPVVGSDWITWNPVTDSAPNVPDRLYGNERTIRAVLSVTRAYGDAHPDAPRVLVGDISRSGGGPMTDEHVSHQNGLDVDIYYPRLDRQLRAARANGQVNWRLAQDLVDGFAAAGAQMIFVGYSTGLHGPAGIVVPYRGHEYHMHVRFPPPS